mmetsp:Transcript_37841/g.110850  ORF Transcript_37841/g.110850 Transcript_37841/m.110850 type:complete len:239 (+) Transcript_37841:265-981(+)
MGGLSSSWANPSTMTRTEASWYGPTPPPPSPRAMAPPRGCATRPRRCCACSLLGPPRLTAGCRVSATTVGATRSSRRWLSSPREGSCKGSTGGLSSAMPRETLHSIGPRCARSPHRAALRSPRCRTATSCREPPTSCRQSCSNQGGAGTRQRAHRTTARSLATRRSSSSVREVSRPSLCSRSQSPAAGASRLQSLPCLRTSPRRLRSTCTCSHGRGASRTPSRRCSRPLGRGCAARAR